MDGPKLPTGLQNAETVVNTVAQMTQSQPDNSKPFWQSKTIWATAITALLPLIPGVGPVAMAWVTANPALFTAGLGAVFAGLRVVTKGSVTVT